MSSRITISLMSRTFSRRGFVSAGSAGLFGLSLPRLLEAEASSGQRELSMIVIWLTGGLSHIDSFDMKPDAATEVRGEFRPAPSAVPGMQICELMPHLRRLANRYTIVRSMTHDQADHVIGEHLMLTAYRRTPAVEYPSMGSVLAKELGWRNDLPPYVLIPEVPAFTYYGPGVLGSEYGPYATGDPNAAGYKVRNLSFPQDVDWDRFERRLAMQKTVDSTVRLAESDPNLAALNHFSQKALSLLASPRARKAFDISEEPEKIRERYGYTLNGQGALLARRLVEAGVRLVLVSKPFGTYDTHFSNFKTLRTELPELDQAISALLEDLHQRGLLDSTIVLVTGEFGRTPKIDVTNAGRDHWPKAFSLLLAGGGCSGGRVIGSTDDTAAEVKDLPITPENLAATLYQRFGIEPHKVLQTSLGRPIALVEGGTPVPMLFT
jgi:uncharacterized protein (DUF1501 family)